MTDFAYEDLLPIGDDETPYRLLTTDGVSVVDGPGGRSFLQVEPKALRLLTDTAMHDIAHYLRPAHLQQLANILDDPEASNNDCSRTRTSPRAASCPCARTPAPRSSWASAASTC